MSNEVMAVCWELLFLAVAAAVVVVTSSFFSRFASLSTYSDSPPDPFRSRSSGGSHGPFGVT